MEMLVRTPNPYKTESLKGFLLRMSELNGYDTPKHILQYADLDSINGRISSDKLASLLGRTPASLSDISNSGLIKNGMVEYLILGHTLGFSKTHCPLRFNNPKFCPLCVIDNGYLDAFWDIKHVIACPKHKCKLSESCPSCCSPISWNRMGILTCACGSSLKSQIVEYLDQPTIDLMEVIKRKLHCCSLMSMRNLSKLPIEYLDGIPLHIFIKILDRLVDLDLATKSWSLNLRVEQSAKILADWPKGYHDFLNRIGTQNQELLQTTGYRIRFKKLCTSLFTKHIFKTHTGFLHNEFIVYGLTQCEESVVDTRSAKGFFGQKRRSMSLSQLSHHTGHSRKTLARLIEASLLSAKVIKTGKSNRYIVNTEKIPAVTRHDGLRFCLRDAAKYIGIPSGVLRCLSKSGDFRQNFQISGTNGYHQNDLDLFCDQLITAASTVKLNIKNPELVSLAEIMSDFKFGSIEKKSDFIRDYLKGALNCIGRVGETIHQIYFSRSQLIQYSRYSRMGSANSTMSCSAASTLIGCPYRTISVLIEMSQLEIELKNNGFKYLKKSSVQSFVEKYIPLASLAKRFNTTAVRLERLAQRWNIGVLAVSVPGRSGGTSSFISRCSLPEFEAEMKRHLAWKVA